MPDTAKLTNVIVTGFREECNLVREGQIFVKDEAEISSRVGVVYFWQVGLSPISKNSVLEALRVQRLAVISIASRGKNMDT